MKGADSKKVYRCIQPDAMDLSNDRAEGHPSLVDSRRCVFDSRRRTF